MKAVTLLLEDDEIFILRSGVRMLKIMLPEEASHELVDSYCKKILEATGGLSDDYMNEIGKMQRAMRRLKQMPAFQQFINSYKDIEKLLVEEMMKEDNGEIPPP